MAEVSSSRSPNLAKVMDRLVRIGTPVIIGGASVLGPAANINKAEAQGQSPSPAIVRSSDTLGIPPPPVEIKSMAPEKEPTIKYSGILEKEMVEGDPETGRSEETNYSLNTPDGTVPIDITSETLRELGPLDSLIGKKIETSLSKSNQVLALEVLPEEKSAVAEVEIKPTGPQAIAFDLCYANDDEISGDDRTSEYYAQYLRKFDKYLRAMSRNTAWVDFNSSQVTAGWNKMDIKMADLINPDGSIDRDKVRKSCRAVVDPEINFADKPVVYHILGGQLGKIVYGATGLRTINEDGVEHTIAEIVLGDDASSDRDVLEHEYGHALGLHHSSYKGDPYGDPFSPVSKKNLIGSVQLTGAERKFLGYSLNNLVIEPGEKKVVELDYLSNNDSTDVQNIEINTGDYSVFVGARKPVEEGPDDPGDQVHTDAVTVHTWKNGDTVDDQPEELRWFGSEGSFNIFGVQIRILEKRSANGKYLVEVTDSRTVVTAPSPTPTQEPHPSPTVRPPKDTQPHNINLPIVGKRWRP